MSPEKFEQELMQIDWLSLSEDEKNDLIIKQTDYINLSRKFIQVFASHSTDVKNLVTSMFLILVLNFFDVDNKHIILLVLGFQILSTIASKASQTMIIEQLETSKKNYIDALRKKKKINT